MCNILNRKTNSSTLILIIAGFIFLVGCASNPSTQTEPSALKENDPVSVNENELSVDDPSLLKNVASSAGKGALAGGAIGTYCLGMCMPGEPFTCAVGILITPACMAVGAVTGTVVGGIAGAAKYNKSNEGSNADKKVVKTEPPKQTLPSYQSTRVDSIESLNKPISNKPIVINSDPCTVWGMSSGKSQEKCV